VKADIALDGVVFAVMEFLLRDWIPVLFFGAMKTEDKIRLAELRDKLRSGKDMTHDELVALLLLQGNENKEGQHCSQREILTSPIPR
jgi:hypothetical protein